MIVVDSSLPAWRLHRSTQRTRSTLIKSDVSRPLHARRRTQSIGTYRSFLPPVPCNAFSFNCVATHYMMKLEHRQTCISVCVCVAQFLVAFTPHQLCWCTVLGFMTLTFCDTLTNMCFRGPLSPTFPTWSYRRKPSATSDISCSNFAKFSACFCATKFPINHALLLGMFCVVWTNWTKK